MSERRVERRPIPDRLYETVWQKLVRWETLLAAIAIVIFALNSVASPYFLDPGLSLILLSPSPRRA
jgi:rhamnose transport system permease protein